LGKLAGVPHLKAIRALEKAGFRIIRQSKHIILSDGKRTLTIPRANPIDPYTMGAIIRDVGMTIDEFRRLL
jgi:predicted RNA binding protein YcfA (HicA-like mRNA interferase family)